MLLFLWVSKCVFVCMCVHLIQYLIFIFTFLNDWKCVFNVLRNLEHTRTHTHTHALPSCSPLHINLGEKTKNGCDGCLFFVLFTFIIVSHTHTWHMAPTKRHTWNMLQFFINYYYFFILLLLLMWASIYTLDHWYLFICFVCWLMLCLVVIFLCPLRAMHRNYSIVFFSLHLLSLLKLSLFFFKRF